MFEDVKRDDQNITGGTPASLGTSQGGSPTDDMFGEVDPVKDRARPMVGPSALEGGKLRPLGQVASDQLAANPQASAGRPIGPSQPLQDLREVNNWEKESKGNFLRKALSVLVVIVVIAAVGVGGWYGYTLIVVPIMNQTGQDANQNSNSNQPNVNTNINLNTNQPGVAPVAPAIIDQDADGLTDVEEATIGTDPKNQDSDRDGLNDYEEVKIYTTDPLNPDTDNDGLNDREEVFVWKTDATKADTDGDGFLDGEEVANGYNPNGPGKLLPDVVQ